MINRTPYEELTVGTERVVLEFSLTEPEFVASYRRMLLRWHTTRAAIAVGLVALVAGGVAVGTFPFLGAVLLALGVVNVGLYGGTVILKPPLAWRRTPELAGPRLYTFSDEGVEARVSHAKMKTDWSRYTVTLENSRFYFLKIRHIAQYVCIPKRTFASSSDELVFRELVDRHTEARLLP